jgi:hypothetical protein
MPDNELVYIDDKRADDSVDVLRRRLTRVLASYVDGPLKFRRQGVDQAEEAKKANCLRLIFMEKDSQAAQEYPEVYPALKGKPLDPIKSAAVTTLTAQMKELDAELARLRFRTTTVAEVTRLQREKMELQRLVYKMRGFSLDEEDENRPFLDVCL